MSLRTRIDRLAARIPGPRIGGPGGLDRELLAYCLAVEHLMEGDHGGLAVARTGRDRTQRQGTGPRDRPRPAARPATSGGDALPGLRSRIDRLAHRLGTDAPKIAIVFYGPHYRRHDIDSTACGTLHLTVPCPWDGDPMEYLSLSNASRSEASIPWSASKASTTAAIGRRYSRSWTT